MAAADPSAPFVEALHKRLPEIDAQVAPAEELPWADETFDAALAQLVVSFMQDAPAGVARDAPRRETRRHDRRLHVGPRRNGDARRGETRPSVLWTPTAHPPTCATARGRRSRACSATGSTTLTRSCSRSSRPTPATTSSGSALSGGAGPAGAWVASLDERAPPGRPRGDPPPARRAARGRSRCSAQGVGDARDPRVARSRGSMIDGRCRVACSAAEGSSRLPSSSRVPRSPGGP